MSQTRPSARRRSRELALQALYQWQIAGQTVADIEAQFAESKEFARADPGFFAALLRGAIDNAAACEDAVRPYLDRDWAEVSPVERAILLLGGHELIATPDVPYRVVINEAIELAKSYGGTDGHKYINGVLDKLAAAVRAAEIAAGASAVRPRARRQAN